MLSSRRSSQTWDLHASVGSSGSLKGLRRDSNISQLEDAAQEEAPQPLMYLHPISSSAGYMEHPEYEPDHTPPWLRDDHRDAHHSGAAEPTYDYFGNPAHHHHIQNHPSLAPTPPYSPLYSPPGYLDQRHHHASHHLHYLPEPVINNGFISPNDVHPSHQADYFGAPTQQEEFYVEQMYERERTGSFESVVQSQDPAWEQEEVPHSPRSSWGSESPRPQDEIQFGESASSPKSSSDPDALNLTVAESATIYGFTRLNATELHATMSTSQLESHPLPPDEFSAFIHPRFYRDEPGRPCPVGQLKPRVAKKKLIGKNDHSHLLTSSQSAMAKINIKAETPLLSPPIVQLAGQKRHSRKSEVARRPRDGKASLFEGPTEPGVWYPDT
ncbi:hypothetical protein P7C70_g4816, partial [Phenoliferia sp. Uapishka_3]